jgi:hypothetical protein
MRLLTTNAGTETGSKTNRKVKIVAGRKQSDITGAIAKDKAVELAAKGAITSQEAGKISGLSQRRINELIQDYKSDTDYITFTNNKDKVFEGLQAKIINNIADDDLKKANLQQKIWATGVLQDKIQVIRGQATEIIDYRSLSLTGTLRELREARARAIDQQKVINNEANEQVVDITNDIA